MAVRVCLGIISNFTRAHCGSSLLNMRSKHSPSCQQGVVRMDSETICAANNASSQRTRRVPHADSGHGADGQTDVHHCTTTTISSSSSIEMSCQYQPSICDARQVGCMAIDDIHAITLCMLSIAVIESSCLAYRIHANIYHTHRLHFH